MLAGTTSTLSVGEIGLREHVLLSDARGSPGGGAVAARGSGLTTVRFGGGAPPPSSSSVPLCMASELRITRKWVLSDGVMVTVFSASGFSFLLNWMTGIRGAGSDGKSVLFRTNERRAYSGCFRKLSPGPLHVRLGSKQTLRGPHHQLRVTLWGEGLRQAMANRKTTRVKKKRSLL